MKKWISMLAILIMVVTISGCTTNQTQPANKTYSASGLSFTYPENWEELDKTSYQSVLGNKGELMVLVGDGAGNAFGIAKLRNIGSQKPTLNYLVMNYNSTLKSNGTEYVSERYLTVDSANGYEITVKSSSNYYSALVFVKNDTGYLAVFQSTGNDQQTFDNIISSLKVP